MNIEKQIELQRSLILEKINCIKTIEFDTIDECIVYLNEWCSQFNAYIYMTSSRVLYNSYSIVFDNPLIPILLSAFSISNNKNMSYIMREELRSKNFTIKFYVSDEFLINYLSTN